MRAADFIDTLGVNTHVGADPYNNPAQITSMLSYLGMHNIRQSSPYNDQMMENVAALGRAGAKIALTVNGGGPVNLPGAMGPVLRLAPYLNAVEGVNEAVIYGLEYKGFHSVDAAIALQKDLYAAVKAEPALAGVPVYIFTLGGHDPAEFPQIGDMSAFADFANIHSYPPDGLRPIFVLHAAIDGGRTSAPSRPVVITETGFYTLPQHKCWGGVTESIQANYTLGLLLDQAAAGVTRTYLYDLIDDGADPNEREHHFGLFRYDGSPKPAATALHNLTTILADPGANKNTFDLDTFSFTAVGVPYNHTGNTQLFQKSDGTHIIALWNEEQTWYPATQTAAPSRHLPTTVEFQRSYSTVHVYDPMIGTSPLQTLHNVAQVTLDLTDHTLLIEIVPEHKAVAAPPPPVTVPVLPPNPDTLVLHLSEDAWLGDAEFNVTVDGQAIGGTRVVTASHAAGQSQAVVLTGAWGAGAHTVGSTFLNDAWGGTPDTDRNLRGRHHLQRTGQPGRPHHAVQRRHPLVQRVRPGYGDADRPCLTRPGRDGLLRCGHAGPASRPLVAAAAIRGTLKANSSVLEPSHLRSSSGVLAPKPKISRQAGICSNSIPVLTWIAHLRLRRAQERGAAACGLRPSCSARPPGQWS